MLAVTTAPAVAPLGAPQADAQDDTGDRTVLRLGVTQSIDTLNPFEAIMASSTELMRLTYESLTMPSAEDMTPTGALAESWDTSDDDLTWTYTIRDDITWSDGEPVTADDIAFTFNLMMDDPDARTANGSYVSTFESVEAPDPTTLVITTTEPQATMLSLDVPIVPEHIWSQVDEIAGYGNDTMPVVGNGPFLITEYRAEEFVRLEANPDYWRGPAEIDELQFRFYRNSDAAVQALRKGEVDLINRLTPAQFDALSGEDDIEVNQAQGRRFYMLSVNAGAATADGDPLGNGHPALQDIAVRQAIARALDRDVLVDRVLGGYGEPGTGYVPPIFADLHWQPEDDQAWNFDPGAANAQLDSAGYERGPDGIRVTEDGDRLSFRLYGRSDRNADTQAGQFVRDWLAEIGIEVDLEIMSGNRMNELQKAGEFDIALSSWAVNPDPNYVLSIQTCDQRPSAAGTGGTTESFFCHEEFDELHAQQLAEFDRETRTELIHQMQRVIHEQSATIMLYYENALEAYRSDRFTDFGYQPADSGVIREQLGYWGYYGATPATNPNASASGTSTGLLLSGGAAVVIIAVAAGWFVTRRRRASADDRE
ncbi:ABC transporter substrate-binding protein [Actinoalloteichus sp. AHMU CJ021]|nr:ABC transporter substrate-binding protein [Actinoalloteichus sp. AHMU CJ021]